MFALPTCQLSGAAGQSHQAGLSPDAVKRNQGNLISPVVKLNGHDADSDPPTRATMSFRRSPKASRGMVYPLGKVFPSLPTRLIKGGGFKHGDSKCRSLQSTKRHIFLVKLQAFLRPLFVRRPGASAQC